MTLIGSGGGPNNGAQFSSSQFGRPGVGPQWPRTPTNPGGVTQASGPSPGSPPRNPKEFMGGRTRGEFDQQQREGLEESDPSFRLEQQQANARMASNVSRGVGEADLGTHLAAARGAKKIPIPGQDRPATLGQQFGQRPQRVNPAGPAATGIGENLRMQSNEFNPPQKGGPTLLPRGTGIRSVSASPGVGGVPSSQAPGEGPGSPSEPRNIQTGTPRADQAPAGSPEGMHVGNAKQRLAASQAANVGNERALMERNTGRTLSNFGANLQGLRHPLTYPGHVRTAAERFLSGQQRSLEMMGRGGYKQAIRGLAGERTPLVPYGSMLRQIYGFGGDEHEHYPHGEEEVEPH